MSKRKEKPYFSDDQLDTLEDIFKDTMNDVRRPWNDRMVQAFREYCQRSKHPYENSLLNDVIAGRYAVAYLNGQVDWSVTKPQSENEEIRRKFQYDHETLNRFMTILAIEGDANAGLICEVEERQQIASDLAHDMDVAAPDVSGVNDTPTDV